MFISTQYICGLIKLVILAAIIFNVLVKNWGGGGGGNVFNGFLI